MVQPPVIHLWICLSEDFYILKFLLYHGRRADDASVLAQGADYDSIDTLLKRDRAERLAREKGEKTEEDSLC